MNHLFDNRHINIPIIKQAMIMAIYKVILDYSFAYYQVLFDHASYHFDFSVLKYLNSWLLLIVVYCIINNSSTNDASRFMLNIIFVAQVIPISTIYAFENEDAVCYNFIVLMVLFVSYVVMIIQPKGLQISEVKLFNGYPLLLLLSIIGSVLIVLLLLFYCVMTRGLPILTAMDFSKIYTVVRADYFIDNKYVGYIYTVMVLALIPFLAAVFSNQRKWIMIIALFVCFFLFFLYSGNKTTLFSLAVFIGIIVVRFFSKADSTIINVLCVGLIAGCLSWIVLGTNRIYDIIIRRVLIVPADLKFAHFHYFCDNEKIGFAGTVLGKVLGANDYANSGRIADETFSYAIGRMLGSEGTNCNTGVLIEGFDRFGVFGFLVFGLILIILLLAIRKYEKNTTHEMALLTMSYFIYSLSDGFIIGSQEFAFITLLIITVAIRFPNNGDAFRLRKARDKIG